MEEQEVLAYVLATARALNLPLDPAHAQAVTLHLGRTAALAQLLESMPLGVEDELAEIYRPAPFPQQDPAP